MKLLIDEKGNLLFVTKALRVFAYSYISIILPLYLLRSGYSAFFVGIVVTVAILSSVFYNVLISKYADSFGRGRSLILLSFMMALSGIIFALNINNYFIMIAAFIGAISVTGTETGPFLSIEQAALTKFTSAEKRTLMYSTYNFIGYTAMAAGSLFSGLPGFLNNFNLYYLLFYVYAAIALILALIYYLLGSNLELDNKKDVQKPITPETKKIIIKLSALFSIDAFGGGFVLQSLLALWFYSRWNLHLSSLSALFFVSGIITALSLFLASRIAKKIGLLNTMVFTHIPSSIFLILIPFSPTAIGSIIFLFARQSLSQMDVPTRQSYMMAIVKPEERTAVAGLTNIPRSIAQASSPALSSFMIQIVQYSIPFVAGGSIKILYDILIFFTFRKIKPPEEK